MSGAEIGHAVLKLRLLLYAASKSGPGRLHAENGSGTHVQVSGSDAKLRKSSLLSQPYSSGVYSRYVVEIKVNENIVDAFKTNLYSRMSTRLASSFQCFKIPALSLKSRSFVIKRRHSYVVH